MSLSSKLASIWKQEMVWKDNQVWKRLIRWVLVQCAYVAIRIDPELNNYFKKLGMEKGKKKAAKKGLCSMEEERSLRRPRLFKSYA